MNWHRVSNYCIKSDCGRFQIAKVIVFGGALYELWDMKQPKPRLPIASGVKAAEVKAEATRAASAEVPHG